MNGVWQQQAMQRQQYGSMIGQPGDVYGGGYQSGAMGDRMMGGAMSRASAIGGPMMGLAGGIMAPGAMAAGAWAGGGALLHGAGLGGAAAAGGMAAVGALPAMAAFGAASYAGGQMMQGASQQMDLNQTLRGSYNFRNQQGGQGFNRGDMTSIGSMIRDMSGQFGPGGEVTGFRELTQLAGKMNTMGLAQGVKDVKDFAEKFKTMVTSLKSMATDLGTTLEGAMEFAAAAKQSGVFGMKNAAAFTHAARTTAVAGGLAVSEVTAAASTGSQISRAMGGLGSQGAGAGMRTIGQIGTAVQMGVLSEKDIYNATGLTGAEGRQAYATSSMEKTASFLQSGRGRRMLASMAGKDGTLDESAVQEFMSGGMSIQETMRLDNKMKSTVGRANFIRNEGRLRGAAMEKLGAFIPAMQMQQWAASKGIDINDMDDRSMLFAQRQLGMGRDEVDSAIKMANAMPRILEEQRRSEARDSGQQQFAMMAKGRGLEGVKTRFEQAKHEINSKIQKVGQDLANSGSEWVEGMMNSLIDNYSQTAQADIDDAFQDMKGGGAIGRGAGRRAFGIGAGGRFAGAKGMSLDGSIQGRGLEERMTRGTAGGAMASLKNTLFGSPTDLMEKGGIGKWLLQGQSGASQLAESGFTLGGLDMRTKFAQISQLQSVAAQAAVQGKDLGSNENSRWIRDLYAMGNIPKGGDARIAGFAEQLRLKNPNAAIQWDHMSEAEKVKYMATEEARAGITGGGALAARYGVPDKLAGLLADIHGAGFKSTADENRAYASAFGLKAGGSVGDRLLSGLSGGLLGGGKSAFGEKDVEAKGAFIKSAEFRDLAQKLLSSDTTVAQKAQDALAGQLGSISADGRTAADDVKEQMLKTAGYTSLLDKHASKEQLEAYAKEKGTTVEELNNRASAMVSIVGEEWKRNRAEEAGRAGIIGRKEMAAGQKMGLYDAESGALSAGTAKELEKIGGTAKAFAMSGLAMSQLQAGLQGGVENDAANQAAMGRMEQEGDAQEKLLRGMSVGQMRAVANSLAGTPAGSLASREAAMETKVAAGNRRKGGANKTLAGILGVQVAGDISTQEGADRVAELYAQNSGIKDDTTIEMIHKAVNAARTGDVKGESMALRGVTESSDYARAQKEKSAEEDESKNPTQAAIKANTERSNKILEGILLATKGGQAALNDINAKTKIGNSEDPQNPGNVHLGHHESTV